MTASATLEMVRAAAEHAREHNSCEHLDGAVPYVVCSCTATFGYHVGHDGDWRYCTEGWCAQ